MLPIKKAYIKFDMNSLNISGNKDAKVSKRFSGKRLGLLSVDEVSIADDGTMQYLRRHNGDQTHQGRHARIGVGEWKLLHIKLYEY